MSMSALWLPSSCGTTPLARQHTEIFPCHTTGDTWPAPSTPHAPGVNSFIATDSPTPALKEAATDSAQ